MFPTLRISLNGISLGANYMVLMDIVPVDDKRYRYAYHRSTWLVAGKADPPAPVRLYMHPDSPFTGEQLLKQIISFEKVKLTNNTTDQNGHVSKRGLYLYSEIFIMDTARRLEWKQLHEKKFPLFLVIFIHKRFRADTSRTKSPQPVGGASISAGFYSR